MLRCIRSTGKVGELARGKYCSFQLQGSVVIVSCHEIQTRGVCSGEGLLCSIRREQRVAYILNHYDISLNPGGKCYSFSLNAPWYDRLMGIVRSVSREYATELSCCIVKRVVGVVAQTHANPSTKIYSN